MKALTIWQPWASLIIAGVKPYEFRGWRAPTWVQGQRIAIHAGARPVKRDEVQDLILRLQGREAWTTGLRPEALAFLESWLVNPGALWRSAVLGTAVLGEPKISAAIVEELGAPVSINDSDRGDHCNWAWPLTSIEPLVPPVDAKGAQGFWDWRAPA